MTANASKHEIIKGWCWYIGVLIIDLGIDFTLRWRSADFYHSGLPEWAWFFMQGFAALLGTYFIFRASRLLNSFLKKASVWTLNAVLGLIIYVLIVYGYVLGLGIDAF